MFAVSNKSGITIEQIRSPETCAVKGGQRSFVASTGKVKLGKTVSLETRISRKNGLNPSIWSIISFAIDELFPVRREAHRVQKGLLDYWRDSSAETRHIVQSVVLRLSSLLQGGGRMGKHFRKACRREQALLLIASFVHQMDSRTLQDLGLSQVVEFMNETPQRSMHCFLRCAIEFERQADRTPATVLLDVIQGENVHIKEQLLLCCWVLDLLETGVLSPDEQHIKEETLARLLTITAGKQA